MKDLAQYDFRLPDHLLTGIFNADISGYEQEDIDLLNKVESKFNDLVKENNGHSWTLDLHDKDSDNFGSYFTWNPDFINLGCTVVDCTLHIFK